MVSQFERLDTPVAREVKKKRIQMVNKRQGPDDSQ